MVDEGALPQHVFPELLCFIDNDPVITHNAAFDQGFLDYECARLQLQRSGADFICTVQLARALFPQLKSYALGSLACAFGLPFLQAHRAGSDAQGTLNLLQHMLAMIGSQYAYESVSSATLRDIIQTQQRTVPGLSTGLSNEIRAA